MNKLTLLAVAMPGVLAFNACKNNTNDEGASIVDSVTVVKKINPQQNIIIEKADADFMTSAASGNIAGAELGQLARQRGGSRLIKNFGVVMIADQFKINNRIRKLASAKNISLPTETDAGQQDTINMLSRKSGTDFDRAYISSVIGDYQKNIKTFEMAARNSADQDIKSFAAKTLPVLHAHLDAINAINYNMK